MNTLMVSMFGSSVVDHVFIGGVMVNMFASSVVEHVFIGGVMVSMFGSSMMNTCSTTLEANMLTITPPINT
jgi:3-phosphoglycerate kinase